jgi:hypothetical protein
MTNYDSWGEEGRQIAYERGYIDALRDVSERLSDSVAFNCGSYRGFEYPVQLVDAMIAECLHQPQSRGQNDA